MPKDIGMITKPTRERVKPRATEEVKTRRPGGDAPTDVYERFLELPVVAVLAALWLVGAAFLVSCALMVYMTGSVLLAELQ